MKLKSMINFVSFYNAFLSPMNMKNGIVGMLSMFRGKVQAISPPYV